MWPRIVHTGEKPCECTDCGKSLRTPLPSWDTKDFPLEKSGVNVVIVGDALVNIYSLNIGEFSLEKSITSALKCER